MTECSVCALVGTRRNFQEISSKGLIVGGWTRKDGDVVNVAVVGSVKGVCSRFSAGGGDVDAVQAPCSLQ